MIDVAPSNPFPWTSHSIISHIKKQSSLYITTNRLLCNHSVVDIAISPIFLVFLNQPHSTPPSCPPLLNLKLLVFSTPYSPFSFIAATISFPSCLPSSLSLLISPRPPCAPLISLSIYSLASHMNLTSPGTDKIST